MDLSECTIRSICRKSKSLEDDALMQMFAWQFPDDGISAFDDSAGLEIELILNSCDAVVGADERQSASAHESSCSSCHQQFPVFAERNKKVVSSDVNSPREAPREVVLTARPFQSLTLPEWVHEKQAEDEIAGFFKCNALASFPSSPVSSKSNSPANSCLSSPETPIKEDFVSRPVEANTRRSTVSWADLADSDDDDSDYIWSATSRASTAASSPAAVWCKPKDTFSDIVDGQVLENVVPTATANEQFVIPGMAISSDFFVAEPEDHELLATTNAAMNASEKQDARQMEVHLAKQNPRRSPIRWVDLIDSDLDPVDYPWSFA